MDKITIILLCFAPVFAGLAVWWAWIAASHKGWMQGFKEGCGIWKPHAEWVSEELRKQLQRDRA